MIHDLEKNPAATLPEYDVAIVGSGPAGISLAAELSGSGLRIAVLESGLERTSARGDRLRRVVSDGIEIKEWSRERVLGGASTTWAGLSSPLDPIDFERSNLALPGWPLRREELLPYWKAAAERYRFASPAHFESDAFRRLKAKGDVAPAFERLDEKVFLAAVEPQDFGREQRQAFEREGVDLWLGATVTALESGSGKSGGPQGRRVAAARLAGGGRVVARVFVLACGGIENARLLLASGGLGNENDAVGRGLMNHPKNYHGVLRLAKPVRSLPYYFGCMFEGFAGYAGLRLREDLQRREGVLNSYVRFEPLFPWSDDRGVEALVLLVKRSKGFLRAWRAKRRGEVVEMRDYSETGDDSELQNARKSALDWVKLAATIALHAPRVAHYLWFRLVARRSLPVRRVRLRNFMEMEPHPENRVTLAADRDENGVPLPLVRHRVSALDRRSLVVLHRILGEEFERAGLGRLETALESAEPWPIDQDASHHMGTTRMGGDPATSVVDPHCRVHGVENLFCAGGSVFPISGCANPTFTIVALAIRLAEHLRRDVLGGSDRKRSDPL